MKNKPLDSDMMNQPYVGKKSLSGLKQFNSSQVSFNENNVELIRNRFAYKAIAYDDIIRIEISEGFQVKNRWLIIVACLVVMIGSCYFILFAIGLFGGLTKVSLSGWFNRGSMLSFWGPAILACFAGVGVASAFVKSHIATIFLDGKEMEVRIKKINDKKLLSKLIFFLKERTDVIMVK